MSEIEKSLAENKLLQARRNREEGMLSLVKNETLYLMIQYFNKRNEALISELCEIAGIPRMLLL